MRFEGRGLKYEFYELRFIISIFVEGHGLTVSSRCDHYAGTSTWCEFDRGVWDIVIGYGCVDVIDISISDCDCDSASKSISISISYHIIANLREPEPGYVYLIMDKGYEAQDRGGGII